MRQRQVIVCGGFDDPRARHLRFLEEAARLGELNVLVWSDETIGQVSRPAAEVSAGRTAYFLDAVRYVTRVIPLQPHSGMSPQSCRELRRQPSPQELSGIRPMAVTTPIDQRLTYCRQHGIEYRVLPAAQMSGFPEPPPMPSPPGRKKVVVTGCYDWFHSGHVRFTEEVSAYGDLYVILGHDANIRLLKGEGIR